MIVLQIAFLETTKDISLLQDIPFRLPSLHTSIYSTSFPLLPTTESQRASPGPGQGEEGDRVKHQTTESPSSLPPSHQGPPPLHQQLNIVEICVILLIGASAAIGKSSAGINSAESNKFNAGSVKLWLRCNPSFIQQSSEEKLRDFINYHFE